ncbi:hypothetical protein VT84_23670 [Gemmata sp. SH-PL17]|uniref:hypothetical protein n=1 Tax=Gemmata sp. SH-PL17 TaxID=1630693 RepID=UPI0004AEFBEF|nr:hypothetical protein [Gemmata sp. SH-PL17]AMV27419.1 hypothetical protein VT84_23670 [Gemmata sp. SH-PL17]
MILPADVPSGFELTTDDDGRPVILYRTHGARLHAIFGIVWLSAWVCGCLWGTYSALWGPDGMDACLMVFMLPFWAALFLVAGWCAWDHFSVTRITLGPDVLEAEKYLYRFRRRRQLAREEVTAVRRVKYVGDDEDSRPSWGLALDRGTEVHVLSRQPIDKVDWLGPIVARWAGVPFAPGWDAAREQRDVL